jgi:hypothetical protein
MRASVDSTQVDLGNDKPTTEALRNDGSVEITKSLTAKQRTSPGFTGLSLPSARVGRWRTTSSECLKGTSIQRSSRRGRSGDDSALQMRSMSSFGMSGLGCRGLVLLRLAMRFGRCAERFVDGRQGGRSSAENFVECGVVNRRQEVVEGRQGGTLSAKSFVEGRVVQRRQDFVKSRQGTRAESLVEGRVEFVPRPKEIVETAKVERKWIIFIVA